MCFCTFPIVLSMSGCVYRDRCALTPTDSAFSKLLIEAVKKHSQETQYVTYLLFDFSLISVSHSHEQTPRGAVKTDQSSQQGHLI